MCGRFTLRTPMSLLVEAFGLPDSVVLEPRFNIAPTQPVAVIRQKSPQDVLTADGFGWTLLSWGLVPFWTKPEAAARPLINARGETIGEKPSFRKSFQSRRCVVLADGYYEWKSEGGRKQPYYIRRVDEQPFAFAGLWDRCQRQTGPLETCTIITTEANERTRPVHDRMPVILTPDTWPIWVGSETGAEVAGLIQPLDNDSLTLFPVSTLVNSPRNDSPECITPTATPE